MTGSSLADVEARPVGQLERAPVEVAVMRAVAVDAGEDVEGVGGGHGVLLGFGCLLPMPRTSGRRSDNSPLIRCPVVSRRSQGSLLNHRRVARRARSSTPVRTRGVRIPD